MAYSKLILYIKHAIISACNHHIIPIIIIAIITTIHSFSIAIAHSTAPSIEFVHDMPTARAYSFLFFHFLLFLQSSTQCLDIKQFVEASVPSNVTAALAICCVKSFYV